MCTSPSDYHQNKCRVKSNFLRVFIKLSIKMFASFLFGEATKLN